MTLFTLVAKELHGQVRTHKATVVVAALVAFGLLSPISAKMLPELLKSAAGEIQVALPQPTALSALDQYLKNLTQMGLLIVILVGMGAIAGERERGTAAMILCKPVSRAAFVGSKFLAYGGLLAAGLTLSALACYYYTAVLFERLNPVAFAAAVGLLGLYLLVLLSLTLLSSAIFRSSLAAGGLAFVMAMLLSLAGALPQLQRFHPGSLPGWGRTIVDGSGGTAWPALFVGVGLVVACAALSWLVFRRHEL